MKPTKKSAVYDVKSGIVLSDLTDDPRCGETYALFLLRGERLLSVRGFPRRVKTDLPAKDALKIAAEEWQQVRRFSEKSSGIALAIRLLNGKKLGLLFPIADVPDAMVGVMLFGGEKSVLRVLRHTFPRHVVQSDSLRGEDAGELRAEDENTVVWLSQLMRRLRYIVSDETKLDVRNRHVLSRWIMKTMFALLTLLGEEEILDRFEEFHNPVPFTGVLPCGSAEWMMCCLCCGALELLRSRRREQITPVWDRELLLPAMDIEVGNRTPLPKVWQECDRIARETGMFFEVCRHRGHIRVRFCPLIPQEMSLYDARAPHPWEGS